MTEKEATAGAHITTASAVTGLRSERAAPAGKEPDRTLRLWPGVLIVGLMWALTTVPVRVLPPGPLVFMLMFMGPMAAAAALCVWYAVFSRRPWLESLGVPAAFAAAGAASMALAHPTFLGMPLFMYGLPVVVS